MKKRLAERIKPEGPNERCGIIVENKGRRRIIELDNIAEEPDKGFEIPAKEMLKYEDTLIATWHTHPGEGSNLSQKDYFGFLMWPKLKHYIIGENGVSAYEIKDGVVLNAD